jgi:hypothetical protein
LGGFLIFLNPLIFIFLFLEIFEPIDFHLFLF